MVPCILRKEVCTTEAKIKLFSNELDEDGAPITLFSGTCKGNFQQVIKESLDRNSRTQNKVGIYLTPADYIPENDYSFCGGELKIGKAKYIITDIAANYDLYGKLNYWTIHTT